MESNGALGSARMGFGNVKHNDLFSINIHLEQASFQAQKWHSSGGNRHKYETHGD